MPFIQSPPSTSLTSNVLSGLTIVVGPVRLNREICVESHRDSNPGVGGSEFHSCQLAFLLAAAGARVVFEWHGVRPNFFEWSDSHDLKTKADLQISNASELVSTKSIFAEKVIIVSHHPHDGWIRRISSRFRDKQLIVVNVGRYQAFSNSLSRLQQVWLPAFSPSSGRTKADIHREAIASDFTVGHISSMHKSKGFHIILKGWLRFAEKHGDIPTQFRVIGSSTLYSGGDDLQMEIPIAGLYGEQIKRILRKFPSAAEKVVFLGRVQGSVMAEIESWDIALLNPLGIAEADPIVFHDCTRAGVPVIAGSLFGLYDYMRHFPGLTAHSSFGISRRLHSFITNESLRERAHARVEDLNLSLSERRDAAEKAWIELSSTFVDNKSKIRGLPLGRPEPTLLLRLALGHLLTGLFRVASLLSYKVAR